MGDKKLYNLLRYAFDLVFLPLFRQFSLALKPLRNTAQNGITTRNKSKKRIQETTSKNNNKKLRMGKKPAPPQRPPANKLKKQNPRNNGKKQNLPCSRGNGPRIARASIPPPSPRNTHLTACLNPLNVLTCEICFYFWIEIRQFSQRFTNIFTLCLMLQFCTYFNMLHISRISH